MHQDWNGTLLIDLDLVVTANDALRQRPVVTADEHRRAFRRPVSDYWPMCWAGRCAGGVRPAGPGLPCHHRRGPPRGDLAEDAPVTPLRAGTQSLLSMRFHPQSWYHRGGLWSEFLRSTGCARLGGGFKAAHQGAHGRLGVDAG
jgi:hypothetical protein